MNHDLDALIDFDHDPWFDPSSANPSSANPPRPTTLKHFSIKMKTIFNGHLRRRNLNVGKLNRLIESGFFYDKDGYTTVIKDNPFNHLLADFIVICCSADYIAKISSIAENTLPCDEFFRDSLNEIVHHNKSYFQPITSPDNCNQE